MSDQKRAAIAELHKEINTIKDQIKQIEELFANAEVDFEKEIKKKKLRQKKG